MPAYNQFLIEVAHKKKRNPSLPYGQIMFDILTDMMPETAEKLRGTENDPSMKEREGITREAHRIIHEDFLKKYS
jgi:hypothetical protein